MNIRLDVVLNDITGQSGMAVIEAILAGHRDPEHLASLVSLRVKKSRKEIANALQGWWRDELLSDYKLRWIFTDSTNERSKSVIK